MYRCRGLLVAATLLCLVGFSVAQSPENDSQSPVGGVPARSNHIVVVMEENRSINYALEYMPYLASLANQYSEGMQVYSDSHGSWLAYGELTSGMAPFGG